MVNSFVKTGACDGALKEGVLKTLLNFTVNFIVLKWYLQFSGSQSRDGLCMEGW